MKSIEFFSHSNYELNVRRGECLKKDIDSETYLGLFSQSVPINEYFFAGELQKRLDEIEKSNKDVNKVVPGKFKRGFGRGRRFRYQPYRYTGRYPSNRGGFLENRRGEGDSTPSADPQEEGRGSRGLQYGELPRRYIGCIIT